MTAVKQNSQRPGMLAAIKKLQKTVTNNYNHENTTSKSGLQKN